MSEDKTPRLLLSAKGVNPATADDYGCDYCERPATGYLFLRQQFCDEHRPSDVPKPPDVRRDEA